MNSFESCGKVHQYFLHTAFQQIIKNKTSLNDYVDDASPSDEIDGFDSDDEIFDNANINEEHFLPLQTHITHQTTIETDSINSAPEVYN